VQETPEALLARCAEILGLAPGQDGASQPQPSWDVDLASLEEEEHDNADKGPEYVPPPPKLSKPISPESSSIPNSSEILVSTCLSIIPFAGSAELTCYRSKILLPPPPPELAPSARAAPALELQT
jgi:hypothetical protein